METVKQQIARVTSFEDCIVTGCRLVYGHDGPHDLGEPTLAEEREANPDYQNAQAGIPPQAEPEELPEGGYGYPFNLEPDIFDGLEWVRNPDYIDPSVLGLPADEIPACGARCAQCGEPYPCSDSQRRDIRPDLRALHVAAQPAAAPAGWDRAEPGPEQALNDFDELERQLYDLAQLRLSQIWENRGAPPEFGHVFDAVHALNRAFHLVQIPDRVTRTLDELYRPAREKRPYPALLER
ncbi:MAG TPA: hypothetical protein VJ725_21560 [Thermoanaerobaculia bacterium]|nr:hypothetical protein [Thermoanaerobaculia bacterium]